MARVSVCPVCGMAMAASRDEVRCVYCGSWFDAAGEAVWEGPEEEAPEVVKNLNKAEAVSFRRVRLSRYIWRSLRRPVKHELSLLMAQVLYVLEEHGPQTSSEIAYRLGADRQAVQRSLQALRRLGLVECVKKPPAAGRLA